MGVNKISSFLELPSGTVDCKNSLLVCYFRSERPNCLNKIRFTSLLLLLLQQTRTHFFAVVFFFLRIYSTSIDCSIFWTPTQSWRRSRTSITFFFEISSIHHQNSPKSLETSFDTPGYSGTTKNSSRLNRLSRKRFRTSWTTTSERKLQGEEDRIHTSRAWLVWTCGDPLPTMSSDWLVRFSAIRASFVCSVERESVVYLNVRMRKYENELGRRNSAQKKNTQNLSKSRQHVRGEEAADQSRRAQKKR